MKKLFLALSIIAFSATISHADEWAKAYGGSYEDWTFSIQETTTGEYITAGYTYSFGAGGSDVWVVKLNSDGTFSWQNSYGGSDYDWAYAVNEISDPGYIVAGYTESFGAGGADAWVLKLTNTGTVSWSKAYGGAASEEFYSVQEVVSTSGYIAVGRTTSFGAGDSDAWVVKLNSDGNVGPSYPGTWQYRYGDADFDSATCIQETADGGYILLVEHWSEYLFKVCQEDTSISCVIDDDCVIGLDDYGPCIEVVNAHSDIVVMKLNADGSIAWQKTYGDLDNDSARCIQQTSDGGYILAGDTRSFGGISKAWVLKLTSTGGISWQKTYGGDWSYASSIKETSDSNYILAGYTYDYGAGFSDSWVLKLNSDGTISWQKTYGGSDFDWAYSVLETSSNEYLVAGRTRSYGADDAFILKLDSNGDIPDCTIIDTSTATAIDTSITAEDSYLAINSTDATITVTSVSNSGTTATIEGICPLSGVDPRCQAYYDLYEYCNDMVAAGREIDYDVCKGYTDQTTCESNGCTWYNGNCMLDVCLTEVSGDDKVTAPDYSVFKKEFGRSGCPCVPDPGDDLCDKYACLYDYCIDLSSAGRELDYDVCKSYTDQTTCESNDCIWYNGNCMLDICLTEVSGDDKVTAPDYSVFKKEFGRSGCP